MHAVTSHTAKRPSVAKSIEKKARAFIKLVTGVDADRVMAFATNSVTLALPDNASVARMRNRISAQLAECDGLKKVTSTGPNGEKTTWSFCGKLVKLIEPADGTTRIELVQNTDDDIVATIEPYKFSQKAMLSTLNQMLGLTKDARVTMADYNAWYDGEDENGDADKFDQAVRDYLGDELYDAAEVCARLDTVLTARLGHSPEPDQYPQVAEVMHDEWDLAEAIIANPARYAAGF